MNKEKMTRFIAILKLAILIGIVIGLSILAYIYFPDIVMIFKDINAVEAFIGKYHALGIVVYILLQILQVVVSVLPGQILQFAAGYLYGFIFGTILSLLGVGLGTIITFYLARLLGTDAMHIIFGEQRIMKYVRILNSKRSYTLMFIFFAIPGIPKDLLTYAAGVSELKLKPFLLISLAGRTPALMATVAMSRMLYNGSYIELIILVGITIFLFIFSILKKDLLIKYGNIFYDKMIHARW